MPSLVQYTDFKGKQGLIIKDFGKLITDREAIARGSAQFQIRQDKWKDLPNLRSPHPVWNFMLMSNREVSLEGSFAVASCQYEGLDPSLLGPDGDTQPTLTIDLETMEEPIATNPNFAAIAGTPKNPKNASMWLHARTGSILLPSTAREPNFTGLGYTFYKFEINGDAGNPFEGVESYLVPGCTVNLSNNTRTAVNLGSIATIQAPPSTHVQGIKDPMNWLSMGVSTTEHIGRFSHKKSWRLSGPKGWNKILYGSGGGSTPSRGGFRRL